MSNVPFSVVVGTTQPWPELRECLESFYSEAVEAGGEVIVLDCNGRGLPADAAVRYPGVHHVSEDGASIYRLRSLGLASARGDVVLITEDHCRPRPGWCAGHLRAHARDPAVAVVGGAVDNGARGRLVDWASFLLGHARFVPPIESGEAKAVDRSNESYKRRVLPRAPSPEGMDEPPTDQRLAASAERMTIDADLVVDHVQSLGLPSMLTIHFHNGRAIGGLRLRRGMGWFERLWRVLATAAVPPVFFLRTVQAIVAGGRLPARAYASLPLIAVMTTLIAAGLLAGLLAGPGRSAHQLR